MRTREHLQPPLAAWITPTEAASLLGVSAQAVKDWCRAGKIGHTITPSGRYRISRLAVDAETARMRRELQC